MSLALQSLVMMVLLACGAVVVIPSLLLQPKPRLSPSLRQGVLRGPGLWLVENPQGQWFLHGDPLSRGDLTKVVRDLGRQQIIHYLPSDALPLANVSNSLRWLRSLAPGSVVLELPPVSRPLR